MSILHYMINIFSHCSSMGISISLDFLLYSRQIRTRIIITRTHQGVSATQNDENNNDNDNVEKYRMTKTIITTKTVTTMMMIITLIRKNEDRYQKRDILEKEIRMKNVEKRSNDYYTLCPTNESFAKRELPLSSGMTYSYTALSCFQPPESYRYPYDQSPLSPSFLFSSSLLYAPHHHFLLLPLLSFPPISITLYPTPNSPTLYLHCTPRYDSFWTFASPLTPIRINYIYIHMYSLFIFLQFSLLSSFCSHYFLS